MLRKSDNSRGMSYVEVAVCLFIVSISILPISQAFVASVKMREEAESISQSTFYAENLLDEIKQQLEKDLIGVRKIETSYSNKANLYSLNEFFEVAAEDFNKKYPTDQYAYEAAIWNIKDIPEVEEKIVISADVLEKAVKFYTDETYQLGSDDLDKLPTFKLGKEHKNLFTDELFFKQFIPAYTETDARTTQIVDVGLLDLKMETGGVLLESSTSFTQLGQAVQFKKNSITTRVPSSQKGYTYTIEKSDTSLATTGTAIVILDIRSLNLGTLQPAVLKFINHTDFFINLKILMNEEDLGKFDNKIHLIISDNQGKKTTIERITALDREDDYLIAVIIRDKAPRLGLSGKIVKTMMDVYTFESPAY
ncbi:type IV pilus modification PilV family protein [Cellulosilyticum sp. I15G10I2]|uniref:type IV pilus modification PilV family protein n=1 Tax=Cellulosilyticum sp. I15G10I2 TaxID=1892843 RepID=UPI00085BB13D|nr:hypothetical protein [Cellulosilyticum sp. I15G10I2]